MGFLVLKLHKSTFLVWNYLLVKHLVCQDLRFLFPSWHCVKTGCSLISSLSKVEVLKACLGFCVPWLIFTLIYEQCPSAPALWTTQFTHSMSCDLVHSPVTSFPGSSTVEGPTDSHQLPGKPAAGACLLLLLPAHLPYHLMGPGFKQAAGFLFREESEWRTWSGSRLRRWNMGN